MPSKNKDNFAVIILSHGRPDNVVTLKTLQNCGYTGQVILLVDNEDKALQAYQDNFSDILHVFDKRDYEGKFLVSDNFNHRRNVVFARNACNDIANKNNLSNYLVLDDDYTSFSFRFDNELKYKCEVVKDLDSLFECMVKFMQSTNVKTICFAQGGDYLGGDQAGLADSIKLKRKAMNTFFLKNEHPIEWIGRLNEDVNTYVLHGRLGDLFFTTNQITINQIPTQANAGGVTEEYLRNGTYVKSFYTVILSPSSVSISEIIGQKNRRIHHRINWNQTVPKIIPETHKKK
jgi:hypothetical protein